MSDEATSAPERPSSPVPEPITFTVKASNDSKFSLSLPPTTTIADVKAKLVELSEIPAERQRLIYSGRVMKNEETLETYKVQSGNTVHLVKGAASNTTASAGGAAPSTPAVPRLAAGSGNNPLAGLTGSRYAGHVQLPRPEMFGPDGGMGPPPDPEGIAQMMSDPMIQAQMNEMLQNPQLLDHIINSNPVLQSMGPGARQLMQSDLFRQMVTDPATIRNMARMGAGANIGGQPSFPAPGQTDNASATEGQQSPLPQSNAQQSQSPSLGANPFASLFNGSAATGAPPNLQTLFNMYGGMPLGTPPAAGAGTGSPPAGGEQPQQSQQNPMGANPFLDPAAMQLLQLMGGVPGGSAPPPGFLSGLLGGMPPAAASPPDHRPPEERYAEQLRQLNDMGFFDFDRNVEALRRSGGSVQGAVNQLLGG